MPSVAEPDVAVVPPAYDVVLVRGSIFAHAHVLIDVRTSIYVRGSMMAAAVVTSSVMATSVMASSVSSAMPFRVRCRDGSKGECRRDRESEINLLQHFVFLQDQSRQRSVAIKSWDRPFTFAVEIQKTHQKVDNGF